MYWTISAALRAHAQRRLGDVAQAARRGMRRLPDVPLPTLEAVSVPVGFLGMSPSTSSVAAGSNRKERTKAAKEEVVRTAEKEQTDNFKFLAYKILEAIHGCFEAGPNLANIESPSRPSSPQGGRVRAKWRPFQPSVAQALTVPPGHTTMIQHTHKTCAGTWRVLCGSHPGTVVNTSRISVCFVSRKKVSAQVPRVRLALCVARTLWPHPSAVPNGSRQTGKWSGAPRAR